MTVRAGAAMPRKVPGELPSSSRSTGDGKVTLSELSRPKLLELRDRQWKLLANKPFITKLSDKGEKIRAFALKIEQKLKAQEEEEVAREMLENLSLNRESVQDVEWKGKIEKNNNTYLDSDDDSDPEDVLQMLSQRTMTERKVKVLKSDKSLITKKDLEELAKDELPHVQYIMSITENLKNPKVFGLFKPYKTTKSDVHDPQKEGLRIKHKNWEVTAATPPPIKHGPARVLSIEESLKLQRSQNQHLKEIESKHAAEKLMSKIGFKIGDVPANTLTTGQYREAESDVSEVSDNESSENEVHDEEPERGGVVFTVMK